MSAETLRRAAVLIQERAKAVAAEDDWRRGIAKLGRRTPKGQHMSGWHPDVALAVADWLDAEAESIAAHVDLGTDPEVAVRLYPHAFAVAEAYLGSASDLPDRR